VTVVLALVCSNGVVIAADTQITDSSRGMSYPAPKLHGLGEFAAWGGSGARSVLLDVERAFEESAGSILEAPDIGRALQQQILPILRHHYEHFVADVPGEDTGQSPSAYVLAAGCTDERPWIIEVNPNAMVSRYEDIGFHAIGSGAPMTQQAGVLLARFRMTERSVDHGTVAAVRVLDALSIVAPNVGGPLDVCSVTSGGAHHFDDKEIEGLREHVERWTELEHRALDDLFA
jgi:20S proteasome alpha/beta subunit